MDALKSSRRSFTAAFKLKVIAVAEETSNRAAAKQFLVTRQNIQMWRKNKEKLQTAPRQQRAARGKPAKFAPLEKTLANWVVEKRCGGYIVTRAKIRVEALRLKQNIAFNALPGVDKFSASNGWLQRFMNRHALCIRVRTKVAQKLPIELEAKVMSFQRFVIDQRKLHNSDLAHIGNMDETPMCFDMVPNRTVNPVGEKTVLVKTTGHEKSNFTCVLAVTASGVKLPPFVIFKRKTLPKYVKFTPGVVVRANVKGWMDEAGVCDWLKNVWNKRPGSILINEPF